MIRALATVFGAAFLSSVALSSQVKDTPTERDLETRASHLRSLSDPERAKETRALAKAILNLPADEARLPLALELSNLATEGDFGRDTLQLVTDALVKAVTGDPLKKDLEDRAAYNELAQLSLYEGMRVHVSAPGYKTALAQVKNMDAQRAKADFTLTDIEGKTWTRSALKGKVVLVNFWATWCPPCRKEMPDLNALYARFKDQGFVILAISSENPETVKNFITKAGYSYPILLDPDNAVNKEYFVEGIPKSFIYDRQGRLVAQTIDMRTRAQFLALLAKAGLK